MFKIIYCVSIKLAILKRYFGLVYTETNVFKSPGAVIGPSVGKW